MSERADTDWVSECQRAVLLKHNTPDNLTCQHHSVQEQTRGALLLLHALMCNLQLTTHTVVAILSTTPT